MFLFADVPKYLFGRIVSFFGILFLWSVLLIILSNVVPTSKRKMYAIVKQRLQSLEDGTAKLVDGNEVFAHPNMALRQKLHNETLFILSFWNNRRDDSKIDELLAER